MMISSNCRGNNRYDRQHNYDYNYGDDEKDRNRKDLSETMSSYSSMSNVGGEVGFIEHKVSKLDTLAGVAIMYGVEVADIKKMNGLVTDLQMFGLKSLQIPLPGRHPPSPCLYNGSHSAGQNSSEHTSSHRKHLDFLDSFQSLKLTSSQRNVSTAMSSLQDYYGLKPRDPETTSKDMANGQYRTPSPASNWPLGCHRKSRSLTNGILDEVNDGFPSRLMAESGELDSERWNEKLVRRRQTSVADFISYTDLLMREENNTGSYSAIKGKGIAQRSPATNRNTSLFMDAEVGGSTSVPMNLKDSSIGDEFSTVRKSSSTSSLQEQDGGSSSIWQAPKWNLKPDLQAFTAVAIAKPIFDGLPKPVTGRRNKTALD